MTFRNPTIRAAVLAVCTFPCLALADDKPAAPPASPPAAAAAPTPSAPAASAPATPRDPQAIMADLNKASEPLRQLVSPSIIGDAKKRAEAAPAALDALKKMIAISDELKADPKTAPAADSVQSQLRTFMAIFGDADALKQLDTQSKSTDPAVALRGQSGTITARWVQASGDEAAQGKIADEAVGLAKAHSRDMGVLSLLMTLSQMAPSTPALADKLTEAAAAMDLPQAAQVKEQVAAEKKMRAYENQPLTIKGKTVEDKSFSTEDWKGKVILVDFWATWCGPCRAELPRVKKAYTDFHDKGLEILGVSNDFDASELTHFVSADKSMPWPQLFDKDAASQQNWNPITTGFGIQGIPTMFLIDKKGICRSVSAREDFEALIPKLLAE